MNKTIAALALVAAAQASPASAQVIAAPPTADPTAISAEPNTDGPPSRGLQGFFSIGPGAVPVFDGAKKYQLIPLMIGNIGWRGVNLEVRGLGARLDLLGESRVQVGPALNFRGNRDSSEDASGRARLLADVDSSVEVGGYVGYRFGGNQYGRGEWAFDVTITKDVGGGHEGVIGTAQVSYAAYRSQKFFLNVDAQTSVVDKKYARAFFGVTPLDASRSRLPIYRPDGGIRDAGAGFTAGYQFNRRWGLIGRLGATHYLGDIKDSPVLDEGSKVQVVGGLGLAYRF